jgi:hypothetical protein
MSPLLERLFKKFISNTIKARSLCYDVRTVHKLREGGSSSENLRILEGLLDEKLPVLNDCYRTLKAKSGTAFDAGDKEAVDMMEKINRSMHETVVGRLAYISRPHQKVRNTGFGDMGKSFKVLQEDVTDVLKDLAERLRMQREQQQDKERLQRRRTSMVPPPQAAPLPRRRETESSAQPQYTRPTQQRQHTDPVLRPVSAHLNLHTPPPSPTMSDMDRRRKKEREAPRVPADDEIIINQKEFLDMIKVLENTWQEELNAEGTMYVYRNMRRKHEVQIERPLGFIRSARW